MLSAMAKLNSVKEYISSILENDIKLIIFAHHIEVMDQLEIHIKSLKFHYIRLDGSVNPETRKKKVDMFQDDSNIKVVSLFPPLKQRQISPRYRSQVRPSLQITERKQNYSQAIPT